MLTLHVNEYCFPCWLQLCPLATLTALAAPRLTADVHKAEAHSVASNEGHAVIVPGTRLYVLIGRTPHSRLLLVRRATCTG